MTELLRTFQTQSFTVINSAIYVLFIERLEFENTDFFSLSYTLYYAFGRQFKVPFLIADAILYFFFCGLYGMLKKCTLVK